MQLYETTISHSDAVVRIMEEFKCSLEEAKKKAGRIDTDGLIIWDSQGLIVPSPCRRKFGY
jgi:hypothetical protein